MIDLELEPKGGGADKPGTVANNGLIMWAARSYISFRLRPLAESTSSPTGREDTSKRISCGGNAPGGNNFMARLTCRATSAEASAIFVLSYKLSLISVNPCIFLLVMV